MTPSCEIPNVIAAARIVPVLTLSDARHAIPVAHALIRGGLHAVEMTLRTPAGLASIERMATIEGLTVGAGTVLTPEQVDQVAAAGARFVVSPGLDADVVRHSQQIGILPVAGIATATEAQAARRLGLRLVKVFPAGQLGGPDFIQALSAPLPDLQFMPSGGVSVESAPDYLELPSVAAVSGSWMLPARAIADRAYSEVELLCRTTMAMVGGKA